MPRLVHLARASAARTIERAGIRGGTAAVLESGGQQSKIERAVFAMPLEPDFSVTYQWVRELRRWHGERIVAAHFVLSSDEDVLVGRYNAAHERLPLREAVRRVLKEPLGSEIVVPRSVRRREVMGIRDVTQLVGWTEVPEPRSNFDCLCQACVPAGTRDLMRRVRASFERHVMEARKAKSNDDVVSALQRLDTPLERAHGRIGPDKLLVFAKAENGEVRRAATWLLGYFRWAQVEATLVRLLSDTHERVRECAVESLVRAGGIQRAYAHLQTDDTVLPFVEHLEYERDVDLATRLLARISLRTSTQVRSRAVDAATDLLRDDELEPGTRNLLLAIVARTAAARHEKFDE
jgi:hypothetical protein